MNLLTVRSLKKDFGIKEVLSNANFSLSKGSKTGLIGTNGSGKSTLLKIIAAIESYDGGEITFSQGARVVYVAQQSDIDESKTVLEQVFADNTEQIDVSGDWDLENNAKIILNKLGINDFGKKIGELSGGYRKRVALASALLATPDILLMDEPTNHLDAASVEWLQGYLGRYRGALLLITHDRYFLDRVTNNILEIDRGELYSYAGNYSYYLEKKAQAEESAASSERKFGGVLRRELEWLKKGPKARSTKQKARIERIRQMQQKEFKQAQGKVEITTASRRIGKKVIELNNISKSYNGNTLIKDFSCIFQPEDRIGIIGPNGSGKSTLLDIIANRTSADNGTVEIGPTIHIGYFDQHCDDMLPNEQQRVIDYLKEVAELVKTADGSVITASQMLERFLFPPAQQYAPLSKLSGGEKRRLFLLRILIGAPNVLILDEPTNDLDVQTLAILEDYLEDFNGCVIVVSHDRYFLDRTVDKIFAFEQQGTLQEYMGNYSIYLEQKQAQQEKAEPVAKKEKKIIPPTKDNGKVSNKQLQEYRKLEKQINEMEQQKSKLEQLLSQSNPTDYNQLQQISSDLELLNEKIETATLRWLDLAERFVNTI
ncbi:MAG: ABC-F family ATP-binding cassette domain-containing protein [Cyanobacteriota bacterium ELA615]